MQHILYMKRGNAAWACSLDMEMQPGLETRLNPTASASPQEYVHQYRIKVTAPLIPTAIHTQLPEMLIYMKTWRVGGSVYVF
jgi:hypothetical protein